MPLKHSSFIGADGCPGGWVAAKIKNPAPFEVELRLFDTVNALLTSPWGAARFIAIDMPIGLPDRGPRGCDKAARAQLGRGRSSSVFPPPIRPMLDCQTYEEANALGKLNGAGLSKQAWNILPKIRELDAALAPADQARLFEAHPELAFQRMNGGTCPPAKKTPEGDAERRRLLSEAGLANLEIALSALSADHPKRTVRPDDMLDACALALTAAVRASGDALHLTDGEKDARGLLMEIWG